MGIQVSRAQTMVEDAVKMGIGVIVKQTIDQSLGIVAQQEVSCINCINCNISNVSQNMMVKMNFEAVADQLSNTDIQTDLQSVISASARAAAEGGLGMQGAQADTVVKKVADLSYEITNAAKTVFRQESLTSQTVSCKDSTNANIQYIEQGELVDVVSKSIATQKSLTSAVTKIVTNIEAEAGAKATGYDPMGIAILLAVVAIVAVVAVVATSSSMGLKMATDILRSPYLWMSVLGVTSVLLASITASQIFHYWPYQAPKLFDSPEDADRKRRLNTGVGVVSAIGLIGSLGGLGVMLYFTLSKRKRLF